MPLSRHCIVIVDAALSIHHLGVEGNVPHIVLIACDMVRRSTAITSWVICLLRLVTNRLIPTEECWRILASLLMLFVNHCSINQMGLLLLGTWVVPNHMLMMIRLMRSIPLLRNTIWFHRSLNYLYRSLRMAHHLTLTCKKKRSNKIGKNKRVGQIMINIRSIIAKRSVLNNWNQNAYGRYLLEVLGNLAAVMLSCIGEHLCLTAHLLLIAVGRAMWNLNEPRLHVRRQPLGSDALRVLLLALRHMLRLLVLLLHLIVNNDSGSDEIDNLWYG